MSRKTRKLIWSAPLLAVLAVAAALAIFAGQPPGWAQADGAPGSVTGLNASDVGRHHIELSWTAPTTGTVTGYRIDMSSDGFVWMLRKDDTGSADISYKVEDLDAATGYYFRVYALNGDHTGPLSIRPLNVSVMTAAAVAPDVLTGLMATDDLENKITLTWQQPTYDGGAKVARYCVLVRGIQADATFAACMDTTASRDTEIGTVIDALNGIQTEITTPIIVDAKDVEAEDGSATWTLSMANDMELGDGVTANFQVVAVNTAGKKSVASNIDEGKTAAAEEATAPTAPGVPANLKLVGENTGETNTVSFYWNRLTDDADATVQVQRQVYVDAVGWTPKKDGTVEAWMDVEVGATDGNGLVARATSLARHAQFIDSDIDVSTDRLRVRYRVRFAENDLPSAWVYSQVLDFPFPRDDEADESSLPEINVDDANTDEVEGLRIVNNMGYFDRIDLDWLRDEYCSAAADNACTTMSQPSTYAVDVIDTDDVALLAGEGADADWDFLTDTISASRTRYKHHTSSNEDATMLVSDETRHYRVFPWHGDRYGYPLVVTGMTKQASVPGRIPNGGLRVTANGDTMLDLDWDAASGDGGSPVTGYIIQVSIDRDNNSVLDATAWCDVEHQAVADGRMYTYDGDIHSTDVTGCASTAAPLPAPLTATGEALVAGYGRWFRVIPLNKKSDTNTTDGEIQHTPSNATVTGWAIPTDSENAIPAFGRTGAAAPPGAEAKPGAPIGLVAETALNVHSGLATDKGVLLTWDVPMETGTADITDYVIQVSVDGSAWSTLEDGVGDDATDWTHSDPLPTATEERAYQVAAVNSVGTGPWSNMAYYSTTSMTMPDHMHSPTTAALTDVEDVTETANADGSVTVSWMGGDNSDSFLLIALDLVSDPRDYEKESISDGMAQMGTIDGLTSDTEYLVIVLAIQGTGDDRMLQYDTLRVTAN